MTETNTMTREQELLEEFKAGVDPDSVPALAERIAALEGEVAAANDRAGKAEKAATAAKAKVTRGEPSKSPRKIGAMKEGEALTDRALDDKGEKIPALTDALAKAEEDGKRVEIVFSDGRKELADVAPAVVSGPAWVDKMQGKFLRDPIEVQGAGKTAFQILGYGLLIDGKQVAYTERHEPLNVAPGTRITLENDIYFK